MAFTSHPPRKNDEAVTRHITNRAHSYKPNTMTEVIENKIDLSKRRRRYFSEDCGLTSCPECGLPLIKKNCPVILAVKSDTDTGEFISNLNGSRFCRTCPVVVFDSDKIEQAARLGIRGDSNLRFLIAGIVDYESIPQEKSHLEMGTDENPIPLVHFLPDLRKITDVNERKTGRNDPCPCGSGKKYKKCCG